MRKFIHALEVLVDRAMAALEWIIATLSAVTDGIVVRVKSLIDQIRDALWRTVNMAYQLAVQLWRLLLQSLHSLALLWVILLAAATPLTLGQEFHLLWLQVIGWLAVGVIGIACASGALNGMRRTEQITESKTGRPLLWTFGAIDILLTIGLVWWTSSHEPKSLYGRLVRSSYEWIAVREAAQLPAGVESLSDFTLEVDSVNRTTPLPSVSTQSRQP